MAMNQSEAHSHQYLNFIHSPEDFKKIPKEEISFVAEEIREELVRITSKNGGHLASNLGVVEMTMAIHRVFNTPHDHVIFDVGHQSYVHKMLTGRYDRMDTIRQAGGLCGFTNREESEHDCFGAGHSSTSLSAALGFAEAERLRGTDGYTVAVLGDGAYTGGMVHEALNNCKSDLPLVIIINENGMSISQNKGTFASYLSKVRISEGYRKWKRGTTNLLLKLPRAIGKPIHSALSFVKDKLTNLVYKKNYFEPLLLKIQTFCVNASLQEPAGSLCQLGKGILQAIVHLTEQTRSEMC